MQRITIQVRLDELGRVTIPKIFRDALGIETGKPITCTINDHGNIEYLIQQEEEKGE